MTDRSKIIEVMARAICAADGFVWERQFSCMTSANGADSPESYLHAAEAALTAYESHLQAKGLAVVPVEDMRHMREVLEALLADMPDPLCEHLHHPFKDQHTYDEDCPVVERLLVAIAKATAMLAASNSTKEESDE